MVDVVTHQLGLAEVMKRHDPQGNLATIAEVLNKTNLIIQDAMWREANDFWSNKTTRRSSLPTGTFRRLYKGVPLGSSDTVQLVDTIGQLYDRSEIDVDAVMSAADPEQFRSDEDKAYVEGLGQTIATKVFYGNALTAPEEFTGLAPRMDALATTNNVLNEGGTGSDVTSIFVVTWGIGGVHMLYPRNSKVGLQMRNLGEVDATDADGYKYRAYATEFKWNIGMAVKHPKAMGRIANIESAGSSNIFDEDNLITLLNRMVVNENTRIYCNETVMTQAEIRLKDKSNVNWSTQDGLGGVPFMKFRGIPVRKCDAIVNTEDALT